MLAGVLETLVEAVAAGDAKAVATMLENGVPPDSRQEGTTALYTAAVAGEAALVALLLRAGADANLLSAGPGGEVRSSLTFHKATVPDAGPSCKRHQARFGRYIQPNAPKLTSPSR